MSQTNQQSHNPNDNLKNQRPRDEAKDASNMPFADRPLVFFVVDEQSDDEIIRAYLALTYAERLDPSIPPHKRASITNELLTLRLTEQHVVIPMITQRTNERHPDEMVGQGQRIRGGYVHVAKECKPISIADVWDANRDDGEVDTNKLFGLLALSASPASPRGRADAKPMVRLKYA